MLDLCISDNNKDLLLKNDTFLPLLLSGLMLNEDHPRAGLPLETRGWLQSMHTECLCQIALYPAGRRALLQNPSICEALQVVAASGLTDESRNLASSALLALSDRDLKRMAGKGEGSRPGHVMLSYQWSHQVSVVLGMLLSLLADNKFYAYFSTAG